MERAVMHRRIDVHHHYLPPPYVKALQKTGGDPSGWHTPDWTLKSDARICDECGIATSILSVTAPGACVFSGSEASKLARECNEYGQQVRDEQPSKYGFFAALPDLLDTKSALEEIRYAFDVCKADGATVFTRYGDANYYLGHPKFEPIWEELNRRSAVVFVHPTHSVDTTLVNKALPQPMVDYAHETTRSAMDMIINGVLDKFSNCKIILSHGGGTLPYLVHRPAAMIADLHLTTMNMDDILERAKMFYFDTALTHGELALPLLQKFAKPGHVLFGSDFPYAPSSTIKLMTESQQSAEVTKDFCDQMERKNALQLFPRLQ